MNNFYFVINTEFINDPGKRERYVLWFGFDFIHSFNHPFSSHIFLPLIQASDLTFSTQHYFCDVMNFYKIKVK